MGRTAITEALCRAAGVAALLAPSTALLGSGCIVVEAPETLEELVVFGFEHFDEDPAYLIATVEGLLPLAEQHADELTEGYHVDNLSDAHLEAAGIADADTTEIIGALGSASYVHGTASVLDALLFPDRVGHEAFPNYATFDISTDSDRACFLGGDCDRYDYRIDSTIDLPIVGDATSVKNYSWRRIELGDGRTAYAGRGLAPQEVELETTLLEVHQQYEFGVIFSESERAARLDAFWVDADLLGIDVPEYFAVENAVQEMQTAADRIDLFIELGY